MQFIKRAIFPLLLLASASANADITYTLDVLSSYPIPSQDLPSLTGSFTLTVPTFVTSDTTFAPDELTSCSVAGGYACGPMQIWPANTPQNSSNYDSIGFGVTVNEIYYYFNPGALSTLGTYDSTLFGSQQAAILTVAVAAIPEPTTYALMLAGLALLGLLSLRRKNKNALIAAPN